MLELLCNYFNLDELQTLCLKLKVNYETLPGDTKRAKAQALISHMYRKKRLSELINVLKQQRPNIKWPNIATIENEAKLLRKNQKYTGIKGVVIEAGSHVQAKYISGLGITIFKDSDSARFNPIRQQLLKNMQTQWIYGFLGDSFQNVDEINLNVESKPDSVQRPWMMDTDHSSSANINIEDIFQKLNGNLLILGEPGAGKTTTLLKLAEKSIKTANRNLQVPTPIIVELVTWAKEKQPIRDWLIKEFNIPNNDKQNWLDTIPFQLFMDGLDEVPGADRTKCVQAINHFRSQYPLHSIVVSCRYEDYEQLTTKLNLFGAVRILPLELKNVIKHLNRKELRLKGVLDALKNDTVLYELITNPLMLSIITLAYRGLTKQELGDFNTSEKRSQHIFEKFVERSYRRKRRDNINYTKIQMIHWLSWLANRMTQQTQNIFFVDDLQPDWLMSDEQSSYRLKVILSGGLVFVLAFTLIFVQLIGYDAGFLEKVAAMVMGGAVGSFLFIFIFALLGGFDIRYLSNFEFLSNIEDRRKTREYIQSRKNPKIPWLVILITWLLVTIGFGWIIEFYTSAWGFPLAGRLFFHCGVAITITPWIGLVAASFVSISKPIYILINGSASALNTIDYVGKLSWSMRWALNTGIFQLICIVLINFLSPTINIGFLNGGISVILFAIFGGILGQFVFKPNTIITSHKRVRQSTENAIWGGLIGGVSFGFYVSLLSTPVSGIIVGLACSLIFGLIFGGFLVIQYLSLRLQLATKNFLPWKLHPFLEDMANRVILRKFAHGYSFYHRVILEYFVSLSEETLAPAEDYFKQGMMILEEKNRDSYDIERAINYFSRAIHLRPDFYDAYLYRACAFNNIDRTQEAIQDLNKVIEHNPLYGEAYLERGRAYHGENFEQANDDYSRAIFLDSKLNKSCVWEAYLRRGSLHLWNDEGDPLVAIKDFSSVIAFNPNYRLAYYYRGLVYQQKLYDFEAALKDAYRCIELTGEADKRSYYNWIQTINKEKALYRKGRYK